MNARLRLLKARKRPFGMRHTADETESWDEWMAAGGLQIIDQASISSAG